MDLSFGLQDHNIYYIFNNYNHLKIVVGMPLIISLYQCFAEIALYV